jgi:hypothetical protein
VLLAVAVFVVTPVADEISALVIEFDKPPEDIDEILMRTEVASIIGQPDRNFRTIIAIDHGWVSNPRQCTSANDPQMV